MKLMNGLFRLLAAASIALACCGSVSAQEGHPYEGTWRGTIGEGADAQPVVIIMDYDGEQLNGMINPGRNSYRFEKATHDAPNWKIDVTTQNRDGEAISFSAVMQEIGSLNRFMEGSWTQGGKDSAFRITRE
ncbi:MAG: hypothetical protein RLZZ227_329 [Pseudomonadota bacterium]